jgi:hypothetical protein
MIFVILLIVLKGNVTGIHRINNAQNYNVLTLQMGLIQSLVLRYYQSVFQMEHSVFKKILVPHIKHRLLVNLVEMMEFVYFFRKNRDAQKLNVHYSVNNNAAKVATGRLIMRVFPILVKHTI